MKKQAIIFILLLTSIKLLIAQTPELKDEYLKINAGANDPLFTTYTAAMERARMYGDRGYKMIYYNNSEPLKYTSDKAGSFYNIWMVNEVAITNVGEFYQKPRIKATFPDMAIIEYMPYKGVKVSETFFVYSSRIALVDMEITNTADRSQEITLFPVYNLDNQNIRILEYNKQNSAYITERHETNKRLISNLNEETYPQNFREVLTANFDPYSFGGYEGNMDSFYDTIKIDHYADNKYDDTLNLAQNGNVDFISLHHKKELNPGEKESVRYLRGVQTIDEDPGEMMEIMGKMKTENLQKYLDDNETLFAEIPRIDFDSESEKLVYLGSFNLVRGCMLPPTEETSHNFYVFSREPIWGWGHGHQVLHESLSMIAYAYLDPHSAQESQRVYMEQQGEDGLIAYRHGPRGPQTYPHKNEPTTSAPFYSWINWEVYKVSGDKEFLSDAYSSGVKYTEWLYENRDDDKDGTFEWGPYGIIENVRDWYNAVFQVSKERYLDVDKEDISDELECLDLSLMVCNEMRNLSKMAEELGKNKEARKWNHKANNLADLINERMWDDETEFYYNIDAKDHTFKFMTRDLKRKEIIGFLPLWAEVAPKDRAEKLIKHLTDTTKFWRKYGVTTLAADDPWYSPDVDYCCKWNGPVWLLWDYMVYDGLRKYGYDEIADQLADKMMLAVTTQLSKNHNFWESFSPDNETLNCPSNYIWDSIMAKILIDLYQNN